MKIKEDLTGRVFGRLTVLKRDLSKIGQARGSYWICLCSCGVEKTISRQSMVVHGTTSCGCLKIEKAKNNCLPQAGSDRNYWIRKYKNRAKKLKIPFSLTKSEFFSICSRNCHYCNQPPEEKTAGYKRKGNNDKFFANGIDRVDPKKGYEIDNCLPCCKTCNFMKTDKSYEDFKKRIELIYKNIIK